IAMTVNKHPKVRAGLCWTKEIAVLVRLHNDANIISIPARFTSIEQAVEMVETFLNTEFEGGRHQNRVNKIACS
ncbi:RpiB/LacA/LacB family sugar-phosphate isomerase, partial [Flavobacterium sp. RS13.1]|uniref:RpiB/LacA/LacB family sugar-phosphate isomerase n=1 Tax=Flavobacterium sp. RS13.1 TaxID=3400345 RepID=UPI003AAC7B4D